MSRLRLLSLPVCALVPLTALSGGVGDAQAQSLDSFAILAGAAITNTGTSVINGNIGVYPGSSVTGFPPGLVTAPYTTYVTDGVAQQAQSDLTTAYNSLRGRPSSGDLTGQDLGGLVLTSGVYSYEAAAQLTGTLTLDGQGNPNATFIINVGSSLTTASSSSVALINGAQGGNVFFVVGASATLGTDTAFTGQILALTSITLNTGADIACGAALAQNGAVVLDTNTISICVLDEAEFGSVISPTASDNETAVADAIDDFVAGGGTLPAAFADLLAFLSPEELAAAFSQLSGEAATAVAPAGMQAMNSFLSQVFSHLDDDGSPFGDNTPVDRPGTVRALGYAGESRAVAASPAFESFDKAPGSLDPSRWNVWASAYGDTSDTDGESGQTRSRSIDTYGIAAGVDYRVTPDTRIGFSMGGGTSDFALSGGLGGGESDFVQAALYARTDFDRAYVSGAIAGSWNDVSTERTITLDGTDRLTSSFSAYDVAGRLETGYRIALPELGALPGASWFTPYGALQVQAFQTPDYEEEAEAGSSVFALRFEEQTTTNVHTELGFKVGHRFTLSDRSSLTLRGKVAWAHDEWSDISIDAGFIALPGSEFTVNGAEPAQDAVLLSAGAEIGLGGGFSAAALFDSRLAEESQAYSGSARLTYAW
ncbi:ice-binding family protein [Terrihabitans rhizophilus]|jgi:outer membrane autotransporter protein|uniref:Ice-binding family protein n=1 Tax=Terrihabitans rhizophilus TaxID=3092662 RepID=A0ABU4RK35_9HYPH|nr:ice-binding family protein [Terrihabitans sp. PJ23]MDX6805204.1 ice-binding family protein [Terrihabitans sp. PJ23]